MHFARRKRFLFCLLWGRCCEWALLGRYRFLLEGGWEDSLEEAKEDKVCWQESEKEEREDLG